MVKWARGFGTDLGKREFKSPSCFQLYVPIPVRKIASFRRKTHKKNITYFNSEMKSLKKMDFEKYI